MKLHQNSRDGNNVISAYTDDSVTVNQQIYRQSLIVGPNILETTWPVSAVELLKREHINALAKLDVEIILLGTGLTQRFPDQRLLIPCFDRNIGVEVMTTPAACRTYGILVGEGRAVAAALIIGEQ